MVKIDETNGAIICDAILNSAYKSRPNRNNKNDNETENDETIKNVINFTPKDAKKVFDVITAFKDTGKKFTPTWFQNKEYILLRSIYDIPFRVDGSKISFDEFCERGLIKGAEIIVKFVQKDGAVYPISVVVNKDGEEYDPFADM